MPEAAHKGNIAIIQLLLDKGVKIDKTNWHGRTALMVAANNNHSQAVDLLLKSGAQVNFRTNRENETALDFALKNNNAQMVKLLKDAGGLSFPSDKKD